MDLTPQAKNALRSRTAAVKTGRAPTKRLRYLAVPATALILALALIFSFSFSSPSLQVQAKDLMSGIQPNPVESQPLSDEFLRATADFSLRLFRETQEGDNALLSPLSAVFALGMTAAGAQGETGAQFEAVLGDGLPVETLAAQYHALAARLTDSRAGTLRLANSIWYRDADWLHVKDSFLQTNADYFGADAYRADFDDPQTAADINKWVELQTDGLIDRMVENIESDTVLYLFNTLLFDMKWESVYQEPDLSTRTFTLEDSTEISHEFMSSTESLYLSDELAEGFVKPYEGGQYSFAALLPREGSLDEFLSALDGERFLAYLQNASQETVAASMPRFDLEDEAVLNEPLKRLGLTAAFDADIADFSAMAEAATGALYVGEVLQKTSITVGAQGTRAGAATKVEMLTEGAMLTSHTVELNRPFVYAIVENETGLPLFLGTVRNPAASK